MQFFNKLHFKYKKVMKKTSNIVVFMLVNLSLFSQVKEAFLSFDQLSHDFGFINDNDSIVKHKFFFINTGMSPLIIYDVSTTCGCTTPKYSKAPVLPGEKKFIEIGFDPKGRSGSFQKRLQ